ncbi:probable leucine-rich repeat receptor-like protein kinase IMK3 isoform X1 [Gossypium arboreum]|uniref:Protein kinase domain-containing protein n=1 Tax=Gossypium arboreum TaxID=29729 RepID=A0ABR0NNE6_GOSAR|nr:probable leucine-rich repeat receptor-like protein kinase IMK3 isoform X1 [Gossypium arboreum]KAK5795676.1 hypothetical protein PVK06_036948 [Gossypium arboreum]
MAIHQQNFGFFISHITHFFLFLHLFIYFFISPVSSQAWDGIIVTSSNFQALQAVKQELIDPKGFLRSWNDTGYGACSGRWLGIKCAKGQVIVIQLPWKGLSGRISDKIGQLQALRKLSLHDNFITGSIPSTLGILPDLRGVQLFNNKLTGSVPASLGSCPSLQTLDLSNNLLTGTIPESLVNSSKLIRLNLSFNSISGFIPVSFTHSNSLTFLALQHNNLSGSIPDSWGSTGENKLQYFTLDHNHLSGTIPVSLSKLSELQEVSFSHNLITGSIPNDIGKVTMVRKLDFSYNAINGNLPVSLFSNMSSLVMLNLKRNKLSGTIPDSVGNISSLVQLDLSENELSGQIPFSLTNLSGLSSLNVSYNNLSGLVPVLLSQKFNSSSFVGNIQLCGYTGSTPCLSPNPPSSGHKHTSGHNHRKLSTKDIILIAAGALLIVLFILCCILITCLVRKKTTSKQGQTTTRSGLKGTSPPVGVDVESGENGGKLVHFDGPMVFGADDLLCATAEIMGKSTYGTVYKATLEDGSQVAVKRLREKIMKTPREFENEVTALGKIRHPNLLALRAYYLGPKGEKLLVFDYMPKGSLSTFLHARGPEMPIAWPTRMRIVKGITRGLLHLHTRENIIHGNLTSSNVLLDHDTQAKITDFGLSRLMTAAANANIVATAGALGYRAPEFSKLKKANTKTDVYSIGVIILELLTGKSPGEGMNGMDLPQWVASIVKEEWTNEVFDLELMKDASSISDELLNTLKLALHCVDPSPSARPEVQQVLQQLEEIRADTPPSSTPS